ncbi:MAG TPA: dTDP-4-dehydrorhamnose 3,5-epimerase family protein [Candidatus Omnitrophota bacterium]|nr:dTDP-4-dehydrorhamnose 3,5-epimerase family protein [Candidatus Omnitrophota bacterium]
MKLIEVKETAIPGVKVVRYGRFADARGFFSESYRRSDFKEDPRLSFLNDIEIYQVNESYSHAKVVRGLHFQWNPYMGKLVRTLRGRMVDIFLDIRKGSKTFGKASMYDMPADTSAEFAEWIWVPPGFAHGNYFSEDSQIEYFCSGSYSPGCEAGISPFAEDIDWSLCPEPLREEFLKIRSGTPLMTDKDRNGFTVGGWSKDSRSDNFKQ